MAKTINTRITTYTGTAAKWAVSNLILLKGEIGYETDTGKFKFGNGVNNYPNLPYAVPTFLADFQEDPNHQLVTQMEKNIWNAKQNKLTFDAVPTENSNNPVTSGGIKGALDEKANVSSIPTKVSDLNNDSNYTTKTYVDGKVASVYKFRGSVATYEDLPETSLTIGDVYNVVASHDGHPSGTNWVWTGETWDALGGSIDLSEYIKSTDVSEIGKTGKLSDGTPDATHRLVTDTEKATWNAKQSKLTFDATPIENSNNPVTSGGIEKALNEKLAKDGGTLGNTTLNGTISGYGATNTASIRYVNFSNVSLSGTISGTSGSGIQGVNLSSCSVTDTPLNNNDISNKKYVDDTVANRVITESTALTDTNDLMRYTDEIIFNGGEL